MSHSLFYCEWSDVVMTGQNVILIETKNLFRISNGILRSESIRTQDDSWSINRDCHGSPVDGETRNDLHKLYVCTDESRCPVDFWIPAGVYPVRKSGLE